MCILLIKDVVLKKKGRGSGFEAISFFVALPSAVPFFAKPPAKAATKWDHRICGLTAAVARGLLLLLSYMYG